MSTPVSTRNEALNGLTITHLSVHDAWPGTLGVNEISGGSYARKPVTLAAASGGLRITSGAVTFNVPALTTRWYGAWENTMFRFAMPVGGASPKNFMADDLTDLVHSTGHGYGNGSKIVFYGGTPPGGLVEGTVYFVVGVTVNNFKVAETLGGVAVDLLSGASFGCVVCGITERVFASADTLQLTQISAAVPD